MSTPVPYVWFAFPASEFGLVLHQHSPGHAAFLRGSEVFAQHPEVATVLDGPMFGDPDIVRYLYFDAAAGIDVQGQPAYAGRGATLSVVNGVASYARGRTVAPGASVAIQGPFTMVENGRNVWPDGHETNSVWRAGVGLLSDGHVLFAIGHGGLPQFTRDALADDYGGATLRFLMYTDGGHSALLRRRDRPGVGYPGEDPRIFGWLVQRLGPASRMPPIGAVGPSGPSAPGPSSPGSPRPSAPTPAYQAGAFQLRPAMRRGNAAALAGVGVLLGLAPKGAELLRKRGR